MEATTSNIWELLKITIQKIKETDENIDYDENAKDGFEKIFKDFKDTIKDNYMVEDVKNLDRHKVGAIIIVSILKSNAVKYKRELTANEKFIGQYLVATSVGFTYMQNCLNKILKGKQYELVEKLSLPQPISCETPYFEIFYRNLFYADNNKEWGLNPLDIADRLFLLEYITLLENNIDPSDLKGC